MDNQETKQGTFVVKHFYNTRSSIRVVMYNVQTGEEVSLTGADVFALLRGKKVTGTFKPRKRGTVYSYKPIDVSIE